MDRIGEKPSDWPVVLTVHGIRTTGDWQRELTDVLTQHKYRHVPLGFGFFSALSLLMPWSRARKVEWFRRVYSDKFATAERLPSVIAHSFGSYIVTKAMLKYDDIRFDKMIVCGSIVSRTYPWSKVLVQRNQVNKVLNEAGGRDLWARLVEWVVSDAGSSGVSGFDDLADGRVVELIHERHEHSDYFYRQNFEQRWVPFLRGSAVAATIPVGDDSFNWKFITTLLLLASLLAALAWFFIRKPFTSVSEYGNLIEALQSNTSKTEAKSAAPDSALIHPEKNRMVDTENSDTMLLYLQGEWVHNGDLPESYDPVAAGRCYKQKNALTTLIFDLLSKDEGKAVSGSWHQSSRIQFLYKPDFPIAYDKTVDGRKACTKSEKIDKAIFFFEENGLIKVFSENWTASNDSKAKIRLWVEECTSNNVDCDPSMFGERAMPNAEYISETRLRIGQMMFVKYKPEQ